MQGYKEAKKILHSSLRNPCISHFGDQLEINKNDLFETWKVLIHIIGLDGNTVMKKISFLIDDKLVTDSLEVANGFNDFLVSIGPALAKDLVSSVNPLSYVKSNTCTNSIVIREVTYLQVRGVIISLNNSTSGHNELPPIVAKTCINEFIEPITYMINESLKSGVFPSELKIARIIPIFKSGDPSLLNNYKPICVASLQKSPDVAKKQKLRFLLILIEKVMTNLLKKLAFYHKYLRSCD